MLSSEAIKINKRAKIAYVSPVTSLNPNTVTVKPTCSKIFLYKWK